MDKSFQEGSWQRTSHGKKKILGSFWHVVTLWYRWQHHGKYKAIKRILCSDWLQDYSRVLLCKIYSYIVKPLLTQLVQSWWLDISFVLFLHFFYLNIASIHKGGKKTLPIFSHLDLMFGHEPICIDLQGIKILWFFTFQTCNVPVSLKKLQCHFWSVR